MPNAFHAMHRIPVEGEYMVNVVLGGLRPKASQPVTIALWVDQKQVQTATHDQEGAASFSDDRQDFGGQSVQMKLRLTAGDHWISVAIPRIYEGLPARFAGPEPVDAAGSAARVQAAGQRAAGAARAVPQAIRRRDGRAREDSAERRPRQRRRSRRTVFVRRRDRRARAWRRSTSAAIATASTCRRARRAS